MVARSPNLTAAEMLDVEDLRRTLKCSRRHVYRLIEDALIPKPVKLGALVRWPAVTIERWLHAGCPPVAITLSKKEGTDEKE